MSLESFYPATLVIINSLITDWALSNWAFTNVYADALKIKKNIKVFSLLWISFQSKNKVSEEINFDRDADSQFVEIKIGCLFQEKHTPNYNSFKTSAFMLKRRWVLFIWSQGFVAGLYILIVLLCFPHTQINYFKIG